MEKRIKLRADVCMIFLPTYCVGIYLLIFCYFHLYLDSSDLHYTYLISQRDRKIVAFCFYKVGRYDRFSLLKMRTETVAK